jgi:hypothetical protein
MQRIASARILTGINSESDECSCDGRWLLRCFTHKLPIYCQFRGTYPSDHELNVLLTLVASTEFALVAAAAYEARSVSDWSFRTRRTLKGPSRRCC